MFQTSPVLLGQYRPLDRYMHRVDARAKMLPVTAVLILALLSHSILFYLVVFGALVAALLTSGISPGSLARSLRPVLILVVITALYHLVFSGRDTPVVYTLVGWNVTEGALTSATFYSMRLLIFVSMAFLITLTSSPSELAESFAALISPLRRLRVPTADLTLILFMAIRFIPVLYEEFTAIRNAQMVRGVSFTGPLFSRLKKTTCIIIPVFAAALQRADDLALALSARGYGATPNRTSLANQQFDLRAGFFGVVSTVAVIAVFFLTERV